MGILARQARLLELRPVGWAFVSLLPLSSGEKVAARPDEIPRVATKIREEPRFSWFYGSPCHLVSAAIAAASDFSSSE